MCYLILCVECCLSLCARFFAFSFFFGFGVGCVCLVCVNSVMYVVRNVIVIVM